MEKALVTVAVEHQTTSVGPPFVVQYAARGAGLRLHLCQATSQGSLGYVCHKVRVSQAINTLQDYRAGTAMIVLESVLA